MIELGVVGERRWMAGSVRGASVPARRAARSTLHTTHAAWVVCIGLSPTKFPEILLEICECVRMSMSGNLSLEGTRYGYAGLSPVIIVVHTSLWLFVVTVQ